MKKINLPPNAPTLIESTRSIGYTTESAIADIIDNSITAKATRIDIYYFPIDSYVAILDNGCGMSATELNNAMRYGSQNPSIKRAENDLGRFGLGMKTASLSQCRVLTVVSKQGNAIEARRWDIDHVILENEWSLLVLETTKHLSGIPHIKDLLQLDSGTLVVWQNLDRLQSGELDFSRSLNKKMDEVRSHLSLVFHRYIQGEPGLDRVTMYMNEMPIIPIDPFLTHRDTKVMADETMYIDESKVIIKAFILPHISNLSSEEIELVGGKEGLKQSQGFYVYRNKRLLVWGTWFRMMRKGELSKLARVQVDIPNELDDLWTLDIKKSTANPPEIVRNNLASVIDRLAERSKRTWEFRGKKETDDSIIHIWNRFKGKEGGFYYSINRNHPVVENLADVSPQVKQTLENLLKVIEENIPLNQLYLDLNSEKAINRENYPSESEIDELLKDMLKQMPTQLQKNELLGRLMVAEPFSSYQALIERYKEGSGLSGNDYS